MRCPLDSSARRCRAAPTISTSSPTCSRPTIPKFRPACRALDVGVGAACIYPLLGHAEYGWSFVGSDVDDASLASAAAIVRANDAPVELRKQASAEHVLAGVLPSEGCAFTLCNPPFYASAEEEAAAAARKWKGLRRKSGGISRSFGGREHELWCPGGEALRDDAHPRERATAARGAVVHVARLGGEEFAEAARGARESAARARRAAQRGHRQQGDARAGVVVHGRRDAARAAGEPGRRQRRRWRCRRVAIRGGATSVRQHHRRGRAQSRAALARVRRPRVRWRERPADGRPLREAQGRTRSSATGNWRAQTASGRPSRAR